MLCCVASSTEAPRLDFFFCGTGAVTCAVYCSFFHCPFRGPGFARTFSFSLALWLLSFFPFGTQSRWMVVFRILSRCTFFSSSSFALLIAGWSFPPSLSAFPCCAWVVACGLLWIGSCCNVSGARSPSGAAAINSAHSASLLFTHPITHSLVHWKLSC